MPLVSARSRRVLVVAALLPGVGLAACGSTSSTPSATHTVVIALNLPVTADAYVDGVITRGATLAVKEQNTKGITINGVSYTLALRTYDDNNEPSQSAQNVATAINDGAVAVIEDGIGAATSAPRSAAAGIPEIVVSNGTTTLMDPANRPSLFRLGISNGSAATRLGTYFSQFAKRVAIIHDDSDSGRDGATQLTLALDTAGSTTATTIEVPATSATFDSQLDQVKASGATGLAVWGSDLFVTKVVATAHANHLSLPIVTGPTGESPAVRAGAGNAATDGLRFVSSRFTTEDDKISFGQFEHRLAAAEGGPTDAVLKDGQGREIRQPNDIEVFSYDAVNLVVAALRKQGGVTTGPGLLTAIGAVNVKSANGDTRGFNPADHEGVSDDDMYIAVIHDMQYAPVADEPLSATLPTEDQVLADFH